MTTPLTMREVFATLAAEGLAPNAPDHLRVLPVPPSAVPPWYVRVFAGLGAWVTALLLLAFLFLTEMVTNAAGSLVVGLIACGVAVALNRLGPRGDFGRQLGLSLSLLGQGLIATGVGMRFTTIVPAAIAMIVVEVVLIAAYADPLHRFLSELAIVAAAVTILIDAAQPSLIPFLQVGLGALAVAVSANEYRLLPTTWWAITRPLHYAAVVSLLALLLLPLQDAFTVRWWGVSALGLGALLALAGWLIARELDSERRAPVGWLALGAGIVGSTMPGMIAALLVLVLGFWRSNRTLMGLAAAFLVVYLGAYYYTLDLTLLRKALTMIGTGAFVLLLRWAAVRTSHTGGTV